MNPKKKKKKKKKEKALEMMPTTMQMTSLNRHLPHVITRNARLKPLRQPPTQSLIRQANPIRRIFSFVLITPTIRLKILPWKIFRVRTPQARMSTWKLELRVCRMSHLLQATLANTKRPVTLTRKWLLYHQRHPWRSL